jgi:hypothetical protein
MQAAKSVQDLLARMTRPMVPNNARQKEELDVNRIPGGCAEQPHLPTLAKLLGYALPF